MFHKSLEIISHKNPDQISKFEKNLIETMLKLIRIFVLAAYSVDDLDGSNVYDVLELVKKASVNVEKNEEAVNEENKQDDQDNPYKTPQKQGRVNFVDKKRRVTFDALE
jgi:hypothetical protein